ncbi:hypothetical protein VHEMI03281 [[Torrubiella] hemipterigena]|uniref:Major facilitator superfamily (MFS) profile domain-containing protein n=1 Tax=[Torrubiella] hemipterigena TaxID=1531966 RepID=A0A0A1TAE3_9HYPO|nr:hypothetical protein VHEMI03281 [[Torrubiella] hemipterigena]
MSMSIENADVTMEKLPDTTGAHGDAQASEPKPKESSTLNPAMKLSGWRLVVTLPCIFTGMFLASMDSSIVSTALVTIGNEFDNFIQTIWVVLGYLISYMTFAMLWPRISDLVGRKWSFIAATVCLLVFSLGCGLSRNLSQLIAFRVLQGLGGSGLYSLGNMVLPEVTPNSWYSFMIAMQGIMFTLAGVLGPLLGGIVSTETTWRWIFYLNLPPCAVIAVVMAFSWSENKPAKCFKERLSDALDYDFVGITLFTAASCCLVLGIQLGGSSYAPWISPDVLGLLVGSVVCGALLIIWNQRLNAASGKSTSVQPLFPSSLLRIRLVSAAFILCFLGGFNMFVAIVNIPQRFQTVHHDTALIAGVRLTPFLVSSALGSVASGMVCARRNWTFGILLTSSSLLFVGSCLLMSSSEGNSSAISPAIYVYQVLYGLGTGGILSGTAYVSGLNSSYRDYGLQSGILSQARIFGGCLGLVLSTVVLNETFRTGLGSVMSVDQVDRLRQSLDYSRFLSPEQQAAVSAAFVTAFAWQFRMAACAAGLGMLAACTCWTRHPVSLQKRLEIGEMIAKGQMSVEEGDAAVRNDSRQRAKAIKGASV